MMRSTKSLLYIRGLLLLATALRFWELGRLPLLGDEAYFWLWSRNLDWAFYDHPLGIAWLIRLSTVLGGQTAFGIRWLNAVLGVLCVALIYRVGATMLSRRAGRLAAITVAAGAPYLLTSRFVYTNVLFLCAMLCTLWAFWSSRRAWMHRSRHTSRFLFGLALAFLFNTKYTAYLLTIALGVWILWTDRALLKTTGFWMNVGLGALGLLPVLGWNLAHDWASFRWQLTHLVTASPGGANVNFLMQLLGNARHATAYLTWPLLVFGALGLLRFRHPAERLLTLIAFAMLVPVSLSPANSPRNLMPGLALLLLLAGHHVPDLGRFAMWSFAGLVMFLFLYGLGTLVTLGSATGWPSSSAVREIRRDAVDGRTLEAALEKYSAPFFAIDYDLAGRIRYETGRAAVSGWGQFSIWGYPDWFTGTVVSWDYLPMDCLSGRLRTIFAQVDAPAVVTVHSLEGSRVLRLWVVRQPRMPSDNIAQVLDFLTLLETCP